MKKVLITGANSYIGMSFEAYMKHWPEKYQVDTLDMQNEHWRKHNFESYDTIFHVAGIAHSDTQRVSEEQRAFYYKINTDLTAETAQKAKSAGVKQFIFMSSAIVYGESAPIGKKRVVTKDTPLSPTNFYGDSKVQAENKLLALDDDNFKVVILRPPMIYGPGSKGNYPILSKLAQKLPIFPKVNNQRSMLYIGNLTEFVRLLIDNAEQGIFFPQNAEYSNTTELVHLIAQVHGKKMRVIPGFSWALKLLSYVTKLVNKAFGSFIYDQDLSQYPTNYRIFSLNESIRITEEIKHE